MSGFVYFRKPASVLATANTRRHFKSTWVQRRVIIPFRDGECRLVRLNSGTPIPLTFDLMLLYKYLTNPKLLQVWYIDLLTYLIVAKKSLLK